jgi:hypothetical protein
MAPSLEGILILNVLLVKLTTPTWNKQPLVDLAEVLREMTLTILLPTVGQGAFAVALKIALYLVL